jgi:hypothetical protein
MVLPVENTSIIEQAEAWTLRKEESSSDFQAEMDPHPEDESMSPVKHEGGDECGGSVVGGSSIDGQETLDHEDNGEENEAFSDEERIDLVADDSIDDSASVGSGDDDVQSNEGMSDGLDNQEDLGLGGVSTHVAVEGELHQDAERVDLEKLKPKQEDAQIAVVSRELPIGDEAVAFANHEMNEDTITKSSTGCAEEESGVGKDDCVDKDQQMAINPEHEGELGSSTELPSKCGAEEGNVDSDAVNEGTIEPAVVTERVVDTVMPSPTRSPARACSLPISRAMATSYSNLPTTPLFDSPTPEASPIKWTKPSWTQVKLKPTEAGAAVKQGASLQAPITHIREYIVSDQDGTHESGSKPSTQQPAAPALRRRASLPTGTSSGIGSPIRWDKPSWTKPQLRATKAGDLVKKGVSLEAPGSPIKSTDAGKVLQWEKPSWVQAKLRPTDKGAVVKTKGDLQKPITKVEKDVSHSFNH